MNDTTPKGYASLELALKAALDQASLGKGKERHASDSLPFDKQPIMELGRMVGPGFPIGQAMKKGREAMGMRSRGEIPQARAELLGAIVYLAAAWTLLWEED